MEVVLPLRSVAKFLAPLLGPLLGKRALKRDLGILPYFEVNYENSIFAKLGGLEDPFEDPAEKNKPMGVSFLWAAEGNLPVPENREKNFKIGRLGSWLVKQQHAKLDEDEIVAILTEKPEEPHGGQSAQLLYYMRARFSEARAFREAGVPPPILGAGALVCCSETMEIVVLRRSTRVKDYPGLYHVFGGGFRPPTELSNHDNNNLRSTIRREVLHEELGLECCAIDHIPKRYMVSLETNTGYLSFHWLGLDISKTASKNAPGSREGSIVYLTKENIVESLLKRDEWVPMGIQVVVYWLALGAPMHDEKYFFETKEAAVEIAYEWAKGRYPDSSDAECRQLIDSVRVPNDPSSQT